jgi:hypothetical protein
MLLDLKILCVSNIPQLEAYWVSMEQRDVIRRSVKGQQLLYISTT